MADVAIQAPRKQSLHAASAAGEWSSLTSYVAHGQARTSFFGETRRKPGQADIRLAIGPVNQALFALNSRPDLSPIWVSLSQPSALISLTVAPRVST